MSDIITPGVARFIYPYQRERLERIVHAVVLRSMGRQPQKLHTEAPISRAEFKRRADFCVETGLRWLKERSFPWEQIADELKTALERWIQHGEYEPRAGGAMWADPDQAPALPGTED
jgi:hypothetical protein